MFIQDLQISADLIKKKLQSLFFQYGQNRYILFDRKIQLHTGIIFRL